MSKWLRRNNYVFINLLIIIGLLVYFGITAPIKSDFIEIKVVDSIEVASSRISMQTGDTSGTFPKYYTLAAAKGNLSSGIRIQDSRDSTVYSLFTANLNNTLFGAVDWMCEDSQYELSVLPQNGMYSKSDAVTACPPLFSLPSKQAWLNLLHYFGGYAIAVNGDTSRMEYYTTKNHSYTAYDYLVEGKGNWSDAFRLEEGVYWTETGNEDSSYVIRVDKEQALIYVDILPNAAPAKCRCVRDSLLRRKVYTGNVLKTTAYHKLPKHEAYYDVVMLNGQMWLDKNIRKDTLEWVNERQYQDYLYSYKAAQVLCFDGWRLPKQKDIDQMFRHVMIQRHYFYPNHSQFVHQDDTAQTYKTFLSSNSGLDFSSYGGHATVDETGEVKFLHYNDFKDYWASEENTVFRFDRRIQKITFHKVPENHRAPCRCMRDIE